MCNKHLIFLALMFLVKWVSPRSLTLVVDTTASMDDEIETIKSHMSLLPHYVKNNSIFEDFILIPFNDREFVSSVMVQSVEDFVDAVDSLKAGGGSDCPENSLAGIRKALELSQSNSIIYLFTDAYAKSASQLSVIENLCRTTHSQVIIFLSGSCTSESPNIGYVDVYYDIAQACSGTIFRIGAYDLRKVFRYMKEMITTDYNDVINYDEFSGRKQFTFTVDSFTKSLLIAVSGESPTVQVVDGNGRSPDVEKLMDTDHSLIVRFSNLKSGEHYVSASCQGTTQLTIYKRNRMPFEFGFSTVVPYSIKETSQRPIPGRINYIYIRLQENQNIQLHSIVIEYIKVKEIITISLEKRQGSRDCYFASISVEPAKPFILKINGKDILENEDVSGSTKIINPQISQVGDTQWLPPRSEIIPLESLMIDYLTNTTVACKVVGYPKPKIWWEDDKETQLSSEDVLIEIPSVYISYVNIANMTTNITLTCKARNTVGESTHDIKLFVNRPVTFDFIQQPKNTTIEYGSSGMIYCEVDAYPQAEIRWLHNGTAADYSKNIEVISDKNAIQIKNMTLSDVGIYTCEAFNFVKTESISANIDITGLDLPDVEAESNVYVKPGDWVEFECRVVKGNPKPKITWKFKSDDDYKFNSLPTDVYAQDNKVKISIVAYEHIGIYQCTAVNMLGEDSEEISLEIEYAPKILDSHNDTLIAKEGQMVELPCEVDAIPEATVKWELSQDDVIVPFDSRHITNDKNTHSFLALWKDSGSYHCTAENRVGSTKKTINVNVLVPPYIKPVVEKVMVVKPGSDVTLSCIVLYGNSVPSTEWMFIAPDSTSVILSRSSANIFLKLKAVSKSDEGLYLCIAENEVGNDRIRIQLIVHSDP